MSSLPYCLEQYDEATPDLLDEEYQSTLREIVRLQKAGPRGKMVVGVIPGDTRPFIGEIDNGVLAIVRAYVSGFPRVGKAEGQGPAAKGVPEEFILLSGSHGSKVALPNVVQPGVLVTSLCLNGELPPAVSWIPLPGLPAFHSKLANTT